MKTVIFTIAILFSSLCLAAPNKDRAAKWAREFHAAKSSAFDALILKDPAKRRATAQTILKLQERAEKLFGDYDDCYRAAAGLVSAYQNEIELTMGSRNAHIAASGLSGTAWEAGQSQYACETKIDALK